METDDETLMALADGEITGDAVARLRAQIAADPALATRYAVFTQTGHRVNAAARDDPDSIVSDALSARIRDLGVNASHDADSVVPMRGPAPRWQPMALAASLALAVGLSAGALFMSGAPQTGPLDMTTELTAQLGTLPSGQQATLTDGREVSIIASFTDGTGAFCREYETTAEDKTAYVSVACRDGSDWSLRFAMAMAPDSGGYAPAASLDALDAFYATTGASQLLSAEAEQTFLK